MYRFILLVLFLTYYYKSNCQQDNRALAFTNDSLGVLRMFGKDVSAFKLPGTMLPLVSYKLNEKQYATAGNADQRLETRISGYQETSKGVNAIITFKNISHDTVHLENVVPFGEHASHVYITGKGKHGLSRTHLFTPGKNPVNVILPDNSWDLGYTSLHASDNSYITALVRRDRASIQKGTRGRFDTHLYPGGSVA